MLPRSPAAARPIGATAPRWRISSPGSIAPRRPASSPRSTPSTRWRPFAATPALLTRRVVSDHFGRGSERRHRALSRHAQNQPPHRAGRSVPDRFRRPIPGRHHRYHPHRDRRRRHGRDARPLHPRAQRPHRHRPRGVPRRHRGRAARQFRARVACGRPGSISITAPATASAAISRCTKARRAFPSSAPPRSSAA